MNMAAALGNNDNHPERCNVSRSTHVSELGKITRNVLTECPLR